MNKYIYSEKDLDLISWERIIDKMTTNIIN